MLVFDATDYRAAIKNALIEKKENVGMTFSFQNLAGACRVQKTYLSKVLNGRGHLNSDQLYLACEYLGFNMEEKAFLDLLFEETRTVLPKRRKELNVEIQQARGLRRKTESHLNVVTSNPSGDDFSDYYLQPDMQIVHMFLTIDRFSKEPSSISQLLRLRPDKLVEIFRKLERMGVIEFSKGQYRVLKERMHLSQDSKLYQPYKHLLRAKSNALLSTLPEDASYNFSAVFSADDKTKLKLQDAFLKFIKEAQELVLNARAREVYQVNFDLFSWSDKQI